MSNQRKPTLSSILTSEEEEKERELKEALRVAAIREAEDIQKTNQQDFADIRRNVGTPYSWIKNAWTIVSNSLKAAGHALGAATIVIPPLNAIMGTMLSILDIVEAIAVSKETRNRRAVKAINATISIGASWAAVAMVALNPATAPIGIALTTGALAVSTLKDAFFWYKANKDLNKAKHELATIEAAIHSVIHDIVYKDHANAIHQLKEINHQIIALERSNAQPAELLELQRKKNMIVHSIDEAVNSQPTILASRDRLKVLKAKIAPLQAGRNEKRQSFFISAVSLIGVALLAVATFAVVGAIVANPITLGIVGLSLLGAATAVSIKNKLSSPKVVKTPLPEKAQIEKQVPLPDHTKSAHFTDTFEIVHKISLQSHHSEKEILHSDREGYHHEFQPISSPPPLPDVSKEQAPDSSRLSPDDPAADSTPHLHP